MPTPKTRTPHAHTAIHNLHAASGCAGRLSPRPTAHAKAASAGSAAAVKPPTDPALRETAP
eukprot:6605377-Lingulodinium_polyedra.AAC.1